MSATQTSTNHVTAIAEIYAAFGQGDLDTILSHVTDDVDWASEPVSNIAPWHGHRHGKAGVTDFITAIGEAATVTEFTPLSLTSNDQDVMAVIRFQFIVNATGKAAAMDLHHWWRFRDGKVCFYRGSEDTLQTAAAFTVD